MHVQRTILCLATIFLWAAHDPDMAFGQSSELMEAYSSYNTLYQRLESEGRRFHISDKEGIA